jgi:hypothetical protein
VYSLGTGFQVGSRETDWIPRVGFIIKTDFCAFLGGDECQYKAPKPEDVNLSLMMNEALRALSRKLIDCDRSRCGPVTAAVTLQTRTKHPSCGPADVEGFFCRLSAEAPPDKRVAIELARNVHSQLDACYTQGRVDERTAEKTGTILRRKLRYGAYASEFRSVMGCDPDVALVPRGERLDEDAIEDRQAQAAAEEDRMEAAQAACPLATLALRRLREHCDGGH